MRGMLSRPPIGHPYYIIIVDDRSLEKSRARNKSKPFNLQLEA